MRRGQPIDRRLAESDRRRGAVLEAIDEGVIVLDADGRVLQANAAASRILAVDVLSGGTGAQWWRALTALRADPDAAVATGADVLRTGRAVRGAAVRIGRADGTSASLSVNYLPWRDADGVVGGLVLAFRAVAEPPAARRRPSDVRDVLQATLDSMPSTVAVLDGRGEILMTNGAWAAFATAQGTAPAGLGSNYLEVCDAATGGASADQAAQAAQGVRAIVAGARDRFSMEYACHSPGEQRWFVMHAARYDGPGPARVVVAHIDVTQRHEAQRRVATQAALLDEIDVSVVATDAGGTVTDWNRGAEDLYGWSRGEAVGRPAAGLLLASEPPDAAAGTARTARTARPREWEGVGRCRNGTTFPALMRDRPLLDGDGQPAGAISISMDLSDRVAASRELTEARNYTQAVADAMGEGLFTVATDGTLVYMNQAAQAMLGWSRDELLGRVMHRVIHSRRADGSAIAAEDSPIARASRNGEKVRVEDDVFRTRDGEDLPVAYTAAPFETDDGVQGCAVVFSDNSERRARETALRQDADKLVWIRRIQDALEHDRFVLHAQPIIDLASGEVVQRELLLRLVGDDEKLIAPGAFLGVAEQFGLIGDIDRWVIRQAIGLAAVGHAVELNLSARSIGDAGILEHIEGCLRDTGADPALLVFEITETAIVEDQTSAHAFANRLHALGSRLALDDFGTGYGGFTYLKQIPVDFLKIDVEFVGDLATNPGSRHVVDAVVALAQGFGLQTVAEGVEDAATMELLRALGVDLVQGFHLGRPEPFDGTSPTDRAHPPATLQPTG